MYTHVPIKIENWTDQRSLRFKIITIPFNNEKMFNDPQWHQCPLWIPLVGAWRKALMEVRLAGSLTGDTVKTQKLWNVSDNPTGIHVISMVSNDALSRPFSWSAIKASDTQPHGHLCYWCQCRTDVCVHAHPSADAHTQTHTHRRCPDAVPL